jgi:SAM-dependent methyltransferase
MSHPDLKTWEGAVQWLRAQPDQQDVVRAAYYDDPLPAVAMRYWESEEWSAIRGLLPGAPGRSALDVGAGRGIASFALARDGFLVTALEPDGSAIVGAAAIRELAAGAHLAIEVVQDFSETLPFPDARFDVVFARAVLHHTRNLEQASGEFFRVLKPGGMLVAVREHVISQPTDLPRFLAAHPLHRYYGGENAFLLRAYVNAIRAAGFQITKILGPFDSDINLAPHTRTSIIREIARRAAAKGVPRRLLESVLGLPGAWFALRGLVRLIDHRPGRLYSFVARRP